MPIILFDIDGTLIRTAGAGKAAMERALVTAFGVTELRDEVKYSGRTDGAIGRDLLTAHGIEPTLANEHRLRDAYLANLPHTLRERGGEVCPGIPELLAALGERPNIVLGLLTGNMRAGAEHKLNHFGMWDRFRCGGFGDDRYDRDDVARAALAHATECVGRAVDPADVWVIGDTPHDVSCARAIGARAVAVATGWHPLDELAGCAPDLLFHDLSDHAQLLAVWR